MSDEKEAQDAITEKISESVEHLNDLLKRAEEAGLPVTVSTEGACVSVSTE